jgi:hypothetical protein
MVNLISGLCMKDIWIPSDVLTKILVDVKDPRVAQICKTFNAIIQSDIYWRGINESLAEYNPELKIGSMKNVKKVLKKCLAFPSEKQLIFLNGVSDGKSLAPLSPELVSKYYTFYKNYNRCLDLDRNFKLSSTFDSKFDNNQITSREYCTQYVNSIAGLYDLLFCICEKWNDDFELSSNYLGDNFDDSQGNSVLYRIQMMKCYLVNELDCGFLMNPDLTLDEIKNQLKLH